MLSRIRKTKEKEKKEEKEKLARQQAETLNVVKRQFGDFRFDYLKACRHEIKDGIPPSSCPFCKLTSKVIRKHFEEEAEARRISKLTSLVKRAYMRRNLLELWGYNQASVTGDIGIGFTAEIAMGDYTVQALKALAEEVQEKVEFITSKGLPADPVSVGQSVASFTDLHNRLQRRLRIQQIGPQAATFLQARIRKMIAVKRTRRDVWRRLELIPETRTRGAFFLDIETNHHWYHWPKIFPSDRPASPATMSRRLNAENKRREKRLKKFKEAFGDASPDCFNDEKAKIMHMKQLVVLRDVAHTAMTVLRKLALEVETGEEDNEDIFLHSTHYSQPVWFSLSHPAPSPRQIGLTIALSVPLDKSGRSPSPAPRQVYSLAAHSHDTHSKESHSVGRAPPSRDSHSRGGSRNDHRDLKSATPDPHDPHRAGTPIRASPAVPASGSRPGTMESQAKEGGDKRRKSLDGRRMSFEGLHAGAVGEEGFYEINRNLRKLEQRAWDALICNTAEEVAQKLLCEECHAALDSAVAFATDTNDIWMPMQDTSEEKGDLRSQAVTEGSLDSSAHLRSVGILSLPSSRPGSRSNSRPPSRSSSPEPFVRSPRAPSPGLTSPRTFAAQVSAAVPSRTSTPLTGSDPKDPKETEEGGHAAVLPVMLQLRLAVPGRGPAGHFRLFFFEGEWVAGTAVSPWTYYPDQVKMKEPILTAIYAYVAQPEIQKMVKNYFIKISKEDPNAASDSFNFTAKTAIASAISPNPVTIQRRASMSRAQQPPVQQEAVIVRPLKGLNSHGFHTPFAPPRTKGPSAGGVVPLYCPQHDVIFGVGGMDITLSSPLSDEEIVRLHGKYSFLKKLSAWKSIVTKAQNSVMRQNNNSKFQSMKYPAAEKQASEENARIAKSHIQLPDAEELLGTEILASFCDRSALSQHATSTAARAAAMQSGKVKAGAGAISTKQVIDPSDSGDAATSSAVNPPNNTAKGLPYIKNSGLIGAVAFALKTYRQRLQYLTTAVDASIFHRIRKVKEIEGIDAGPPPVNPKFDLLVVDVYVDYTKKLAELNSAEGGFTGTEGFRAPKADLSRPTAASTATGAGKGRNNSMLRTQSVSVEDINAPTTDTLQVVGMFSCELSKCPPSLELGLFDWDYFMKLRAEADRDALLAWQNPDEAKLKRDVRTHDMKKEKVWSRPEESSGLIVHKARSKSGQDIQVRMIGHPQSKRHLETALPKKVQKWIGM